MPQVTIARLREVAGPNLYASNAFKLTGLPTDARRAEVLHRRQQLRAMHELGLEEGSEEAHAAFDRILGDPRRRLVEELFWLWETAEPRCGCPLGVHREHDAAVRAHAAALEQTRAGTQRERQSRWQAAADRWTHALLGDALWTHVRQRIRALDDRQLSESVVEELRTELLAALVKPLIQLAATEAHPGWLADVARSWPAPPRVVDDLVEAAATPLFDTVDSRTNDAFRLARSGQVEEAVQVLSGQVVPSLRRLIELAPPDRHRRTAMAEDAVAIVYNNCASLVLDSPRTDAGEKAGYWLAQAADLATDPRTVALIQDNRDGLAEMQKTLGEIERQVRQLVAYGRTHQARAMLLRVKRALGDTPGASAIDRMLADLDRRSPTTRQRSGTGWLVVALTVIAVVVLPLVLSRCDGAGAAVPHESQPTVTRSAPR